MEQTKKTVKRETKETAYFSTIEKLPLGRFLDCICDYDLTALIITGEPSEDNLLEAWGNIMSQYNDLLGSQDLQYRRYINAYRDLSMLQSKHNKIVMLVEVMRNYYVEPFADYLRKLTCRKLDFDTSDLTAYTKNLDKCLAVAKGINIEIKIETSTLAALEKEINQNNAPTTKATRANFQKTLMNLSDHAGRELTEDMSVFMFCERINRYKKYIEDANRKQ